MQKRRTRSLKKPDGAVAKRHLEEHTQGFKAEYELAMADMSNGATHWSKANVHLQEIKARKLYKLVSNTLDEYAETHLGFSGRRMRQIVAHERFLAEMTKSGTNCTAFGAALAEGGLRELGALADDTQRREAVKKASEMAEAEGDLTVKQRHVKAAVAEVVDDADREARPEVDALARAIEQEDPIVECQKSLKAIGAMAIALADAPIGRYINAQALKADLNGIWRTLKFALPYGVCPYCGGDRCDTCKSTGWMPRDVWQAAPSEMREQVAHR